MTARTAQDRHSDSRLRRRRAVCGAACATRPIPISTSRSRPRACSANAAARAWCRAATTWRSIPATRSSAISWTRSRAANGCRTRSSPGRWCRRAVERVRELENEIGCFFDRNPDGTLHGKAFAGQTFDRTVHKGDLTGIEIINRLMEQVWARPIRRLEEHRAVALDPGEGRRARRRADDRYPHRRIPLRRRRRPCCWRPAAARPCTAITRRPATRAWTGWRWRCAPACRCATWRWCSSIRPACLPGRTRA